MPLISSSVAFWMKPVRLSLACEPVSASQASSMTDKTGSSPRILFMRVF